MIQLTEEDNYHKNAIVSLNHKTAVKHATWSKENRQFLQMSKLLFEVIVFNNVFYRATRRAGIDTKPTANTYRISKISVKTTA